MEDTIPYNTQSLLSKFTTLQDVQGTRCANKKTIP